MQGKTEFKVLGEPPQCLELKQNQNKEDENAIGDAEPWSFLSLNILKGEVHRDVGVGQIETCLDDDQYQTR